MPDGISYTWAKAMRRRMTSPEARLWVCLRGARFRGLKFRRQHPVGPYILDFYCAAARLAVEVDGGRTRRRNRRRMTGGGRRG